MRLFEGTISDPWKSIFLFVCLFSLKALDVLTQELTAHLDEDMQLELLELEKEKVPFDP